MLHVVERERLERERLERLECRRERFEWLWLERVAEGNATEKKRGEKDLPVVIILVQDDEEREKAADRTLWPAGFFSTSAQIEAGVISSDGRDTMMEMLMSWPWFIRVQLGVCCLVMVSYRYHL